TILYLHPEHHFLQQTAVIDSLSTLGPVICPRHPGFDGRKPPDDFRSVDDLAYLYLDLLTSLDLRDVLVVGSSLGGWVALEMAVRNLDRVAGLALLSPLGVKPGERDTRAFADLSALEEQEVSRRLYADPDAYAPRFAELDDAQMLLIALERQYLAWYAWQPYLHNPGLNRWLHRIRCPVLLMWGRQDGYVALDVGHALCAALPDARLGVIDSAGHHPLVERPEQSMAALRAFASDLPAPGRR
ncbi:MAG: alpha/beta hydrolase, partial [Gammaproteobacteria bacterium]|nr:alpha/beta hydrolase [Gammaproteobacteria bacterium]